MTEIPYICVLNSIRRKNTRYRRIGNAFTLNRATWTGAKLCLWACNRDNKISEGYGDYEFIYIEDGSRD